MSRSTSTDYLHRLIHALTPEEKSFVKKHALNKTLIHLFDVVNRQEAPDEEKIKVRFPHYPVLKMRLFDLILKLLYDLHREKNSRYRMLYQFIISDILHKKGLQEKAISIVKDSITLAKEEDDFPLENLLIRQMWGLTHQKWNHKELKTKIHNYFSELDHIKQNQNIADRLLLVKVKLGLHLLSGWFLDPEIATNLEAIDVDLLKDKNIKSISPNMDRRRLIALGTYYTAMNDHDTACSLYKKVHLIDFKNLNERRLPFAFEMYIDSLRLLFVTCIITGQIKEMEKVFALFLKQKMITQKEKTTCDLLKLNFESMMCWIKGQHKEGEKLLAQAGKTLQNSVKLNIRISHFWDYWAYKILFQFSNRHFKQAYNDIMELRTYDLKTNAPKYYKDVELLLILIQIEDGEYAIAKNLIKNVLRRASSLKLSPFEKSFLTLLKRMEASDEINTFKEIENLIQHSTEETSILSVLNIKDWVTAKIKGVPLATVYSGKLHIKRARRTGGS